MQVVVDTNLVVSAMVFGGRLAWLQDALITGAVAPVVCHQTIQELTRVLAYDKLRLTTDRQLRILNQYVAHARAMTLDEPWPALPERCRDRKDEMFVALAVKAQVPLVTGDADLTSMVDTASIQIMMAAELRLLMEQTGRL